VRRVEVYGGTPRGLEGQPLDWLHPDAMDPAVFPAADRPIVTALRLPQLMLISGPDTGDPPSFLDRLAQAIEAGIRLVQLRAHELDPVAYVRLAESAYSLCARHGATLLLNRDQDEVEGVPRHGLHLTDRRLAGLSCRPGPRGDLVGASCHDSIGLARAAALGLDYAILSPVRKTASHPDSAPLGWQRFADLVDPAPLPVYALGGLDPTDLGEAIRYGAQGIAAIRSLWPGSEEPGKR
jgi:8-oxo-dGTP diphosphatase